MSNTISPNMGLVIPGVGSEPGPDWATDLNASLSIVDQHNHSSGQGLPIQPNGMNINADLAFNSNNATLLRSTRYAPQGATLSLPADVGCLYVVGNELYYNDVTGGHQIAITSNGSVNAGAGSIFGLPSGTASASYSAGTFVWQSATSTPANMDAGSYIFRNSIANSKGLTLSPPAAMATNFALVLPSLPAAQSFMSIDTSGNMVGYTPVSQGITAAMVDPTAGLNPPGAIIAFGGVAAPSGYLLCDGSAVSRSTYSALFSAISTAYGAGNGTTTFNVPDLRGMFLRGVTGSTSNDPDASSRTANNSGGNTGNNVGSQQTSAFANHSHSITTWSLGNNGSNVVGNTDNSVTGGNTTGSAGGSTETRPINVYVNYVIKT